MGNKIFISIIIAVSSVVVLLVWQASTSHVSLVLLPSDLAQEHADKTRLRVAGRVAADTIDYQIEPSALLKFRIHDPGSKKTSADELTIPVEYRGLRPDMFAAGRDVILDGEWQSGQFIASKLMTQCPSKYEPPDPNKLYKETSTQ